ncbi:MAG TPA: TetR/AcrR family transcriptional regulator [Acidimicrobiales bacterium]|nr:TetR/AcrR family transcriptional regulator [Acidimicrobiales bacterium]
MVRTPELTQAVARRSLERSMAQRERSYRLEVQRIVDATYRVVARTGSFDPRLRDILTESGLSTQAFYKHFRSKDELMLVLLDDGRRRLVGYLAHRMEKSAGPEARIRAWIEGVLAQAADPDVAARTRPFLAHQDRLVEQFPEEQQQSVELLVGLLADVITELPGGRSAAAARRDARAVYELAFGTLHAHLSRGTRPTAADTDHLVQFCLKGIGAP